MSAWVLDFQGLGAGEEVDEKGIGGEKGRNEALMKACDSCGTSENWPLQLPHRHVVVVHHRSRKRITQKYLDHFAGLHARTLLDLTHLPSYSLHLTPLHPILPLYSDPCSDPRRRVHSAQP